MKPKTKPNLKEKANKYFTIFLSIWAGALANMISVALLGVTPLTILYYSLYAVTILFSLRAIYLLSSNNSDLFEFQNTIQAVLRWPLSWKFHIIAFISPIFLGFLLSANIAFFVIGITLSQLSFCLFHMIDDWKELQPFSFSFGLISVIVMYGITDILVFFVAAFTSSMLSLWLLSHLFLECNQPDSNVNMTMMLMFVPVCLSYLMNYIIDFFFDFLLQNEDDAPAVCNTQIGLYYNPIRSNVLNEELNPYNHFSKVLDASRDVVQDIFPEGFEGPQKN
ncbi:MAG: hypothetical protein CMF41_06130 [Legionellales bacterium]|nr:hypothetical protein [Legionellales bacterium]|tara:strand:+ start:418 stop:1254 length:837 start_codon:yes stop_codon:yes gene_type:complete